MKQLKKIQQICIQAVRRHPRKVVILGLLCLYWLFCLPRPLFHQPISYLLEDRDGNLLGARIAADGQWRFPAPDHLPEKYAQCAVAFEDKRFWYHPGVDPIGLVRAIGQNIRAGKVKSGGSTITMQVIRMALGNPDRDLWEKIKEAFMATRLELTYRKKEILSLYAANAPFGGNVVGMEAASWRWFGKKPDLLTWAEAATLAVLPNSPALIHPGRNRQKLLEKRNRLLDRLQENQVLDAETCTLAKEEPLPEIPLPLPQLAPHLLDKLTTNPEFFNIPGEKSDNPLRITSTLNTPIQAMLNDVLVRRLQAYQGNGIHNLAAVVLDVATGEVLGYVGNVPGTGKENGESVDIAAAPRSTGSILKPFLYTLALESGDILPQSLLSDVPTQMGQYKPENFFEYYDGVVPANRALIRSLNVPFVLLLQQYGLEKFHHNLGRLGISTLPYPPDHYGLSLILGGAEANLLDITNVYACMGRELLYFYDRNGHYDQTDFRPPIFRKRTKPLVPQPVKDAPLLSAGSIWAGFQAMQEVERPNSSGEWELFQAAQRIAWKTGTSYGFRDAWAAGVSPQYAVGVWVGNADGEGRPGMIGVQYAAPVLFEIMALLPQKLHTPGWFDPPYDAMVSIPVCRYSGYRAGENCPVDTSMVPKTGLNAPLCRYCRSLHLDATAHWQVTSDCEAPAQMVHQSWFVLSPLEEYYYRQKNPQYTPPPPFRADCQATLAAENSAPMQLVYPKQLRKIYVPIELDGKQGRTVFQATHRRKDAVIHWHLDAQYIGETRDFHQIELFPPVGKHQLTLVDDNGYRLVQAFEIVDK